jgi:hypothetical protein
MPLPKSVRSSASVKSELAAERVQRNSPEIAQSVPADDQLLVDSCKKGIKRERSYIQLNSNSKSAKKTELLKCEHNLECCSEAYCDVKYFQKHQSLIEEVYFHGSSSHTSDSTQSESPRTPVLNHHAARHLGHFMESFASAFPSEYQDLIILLDSFQERRCSVVSLVRYWVFVTNFAGLLLFACAFQTFLII